MTLATEWHPCEKEDREQNLMTLRIAKAKHGEGAIRCLCSDEARYFSSGEFIRRAGEIGVGVKRSPPRSPWTIGAEERSHRTSKAALRSIVAHLKGRLSRLSKQNLALAEERVLALMNARPLGTFRIEDGVEAITPDLPRQGFTRPKRDSVESRDEDSLPLDLRGFARAAREIYAEEIFPELRRNVAVELQRKYGKPRGTRHCAQEIRSPFTVKPPVPFIRNGGWVTCWTMVLKGGF